jgi:DNA-binding CsgD family transcriptional regulator
VPAEKNRRIGRYLLLETAANIRHYQNDGGHTPMGLSGDTLNLLKLSDFHPLPNFAMTDPEFESAETQVLWQALSKTPGIGLSVIDSQGEILYVNKHSCIWFLGGPDVKYEGKNLSDFHPSEFVEERMEMIKQVVTDDAPLAIEHIYHGRRIHSTLWPVIDDEHPFNRVLVVSLLHRKDTDDFKPNGHIETFDTEFIGLGPLSVLSRREVEVLALLGHGLSVPSAAKILHRSPKTIERHKTSISKKLELRGQAELIAIASAVGLQMSDAHLKRFPKGE